jgi:pantetheine-phosphate adenylyltransferase
MRAIFPASFDPITNGHLDLITRARALFGEVIVAVYERPEKPLLFSWQERIELSRAATAHLSNIHVEGFSGLMVEYARGIGASVVVRGLRVESDFETEQLYVMTNHVLAPNLETVCLISDPAFIYISSSRVKEIALLGGDISSMVPPPVQVRLARLVEERRQRPPQ